MNNVIDKIIEGLKNVKELSISDSAKAEHIKGILTFADILIGKQNVDS